MTGSRIDRQPVAHASTDTSVSDVLLESLILQGCRRAFGILGGAAVPFFSALVRSGLKPAHVRHEAGAVFIALEHELAGGGPGLVFTTTGPGLTNTLTGVAAARQEGGRVIVVSAATGADRRGRGAFQESDARSYAHCGLYASGGWFDYAVTIESAAELPVVCGRLAEGLARPQGFVAHVALPLSIQTTPARPLTGPGGQQSLPPRACAATIEQCAERLTKGSVVVWVGYGARRIAPQIRQLVDALDARVMSSPRGKGIFPESDTRFLGVTGFGGHARVFDRLARTPATTTLVLGTRLREFTSFWDERLIGDSELIHVDVDPLAFGAAYPQAPTLAVQSEVGSFVDAVLEELLFGAPLPARRRALAAATETPQPTPGLVRPSALMRAIQRVIVEGTDAPVSAEAGNSFLWTTNALSFDDPGRYRTSMAFGSMGHYTAGVVGAAMAHQGVAVAVVGDGSMLMSNELNTAVTLDVPAVWIVLNDGRYGLVADGMTGLGHEPVGLDMARVDFAAMARAMGARGLVAEDEESLDAALTEAVTCGGPVLVDVRIDRSEQAPFEARNRSLASQQDAAGPRRS